MIDPEKYNLEIKVSLFISNLLFIMNFICSNKIIWYDFLNSEKYDNIFLNSRIKENLKYWPIKENYFSQINSLEKITWDNFINIIKWEFKDFNEIKFIKNFKNDFKEIDSTPESCAILLYDLDRKVN